MAVIVKSIDRLNPELINSFKDLSAATIHESIGKDTSNVMDYTIKPIAEGMKVVGSALTVESFPADNLTVHVAMTLAKPGDVLVVNGHGMPGVMFGAQMAFQSIQSKVAGIVVDGAVRDSSEIKQMRFPCFTKIVSPLGSAKGTPGSINIPIQCGGVLVNPGDLIVGDDDGVVVVPKKLAAEVHARSISRMEKEKKDRDLFLSGMTSMKMYEFEKILKAKQVKEVDSLDDDAR